jgi:hypothetical protein
VDELEEVIEPAPVSRHTGREEGRGAERLPRPFRCRYCGTSCPPVVMRQWFQWTWITLVVLLLTTCLFWWIALFIKEDVRVCAQCGAKL